MKDVKAKHTVGDPIHVQLFYKDGCSSMTHYGGVTGAHIHTGSHFPDRVLYDIWLEQADAPHIRITGLPEGFVLPGGPVETTEDIEYEKEALGRINEMCEQSLPPDLFEEWVKIQGTLKTTRKRLKETA